MKLNINPLQSCVFPCCIYPKALEPFLGSKTAQTQSYSNYKATLKDNLLKHIRSQHEGIKYPCDQCEFKSTGKPQFLINKNKSPWDGRIHKIYKVLTCITPNLVYYLVCTDCPGRPGVTPHYTGSSVCVKRRISAHKSDMSRGVGKDCGFCEHWATFHRGQLKTFPNYESTSWTVVRIRGGGRMTIQTSRGWRSAGWSPSAAWRAWTRSRG